MNLFVNRRVVLGAIGLSALLGGGLLLNKAQAKDDSPKGKVAPWTAMKTANADLKGKPLTATFASEGGKWIYDVLITKDGKLYEVEVDAASGKAAKPEIVTVEEEAQEMSDDLNKAMGVTPTVKTPGAKESDEKDEKEEKDEKPEKGETPEKPEAK